MPISPRHTDQELLEALNLGDEKAFDILFDRYWYKAYEAAFAKIKSRETAEEIVQDIFMSLWDKRGTLAIQNFHSYLMSSIKYKSIDLIRIRMVQQKYWAYYKEYIPQSDDTTEKSVAFDELIETLEESIVNIPEKSRKIFFLNKLEGKSVKEIAQLLHVSEKAIEYHLTKSLKELRPYLKDFISVVLLYCMAE
jgi:RNA polymerase sigma-70 factor (family 1)